MKILIIYCIKIINKECFFNIFLKFLEEGRGVIKMCF